MENFISNTAKINEITIRNYKNETIEISGMVEEINIFDSVYNNCINGTIKILDSNDLVEQLPLIGQETITIDYILPGFDDTNNYVLENLRIYKITDRVISSDKIQHYTLWFCSVELMSSFELKINKAWKSATSGDIVNDVFKYLNSTKTFIIQDTIGLHNFISTNFSPLEVMNYIASKRSLSKDNLSDYVFFESFDSTKKNSVFYFVSLSDLAQKKEVATLTYHTAVLKNNLNKNIFPYNIENITFAKGFDVLENKANGLYNQTYAYYDILRKKHVIQKNEYDDVFNESKDYKVDGKNANKIFGLNTKTYSEYYKPVIVNSFPSRISLSKGIDNLYNKGTTRNAKRSSSEYLSSHAEQYELNSTLLEETLYKRQVLLREFENNKIFLNDLSGNYNFVSGNTVIFNKPHIVHNKKEIIKKTQSDYDKYISGKYLITRSRHRLTRTNTMNWNYKNYIEISKNSVASSL